MNNYSTSTRYLIGSLLLLGALLMSLPAVAQELSGTWESREWNDRYPGERIQLNLEISRRGENWNNGFSIDLDDLRGLSGSTARGTADDVAFELVRAAGTITFTGDFRNGRGRGTFAFQADASYIQQMGQLGYPDLDDRDLYSFTLHDVSLEYVRGLRELGYADVSKKDLTRFAIHGVRLEYIRGMNSLGYADITAEDLVRMRIHGVSLDFVREVRAALQ